MNKKITIELDSKYTEQLELLKQIIPSTEGKKITNDSEIVEALIESFIGFLREQGENEKSEGGGGCGGGSCGCSH